MSRPLRCEFDGALYHVTSRGDRKGVIFRDDGDRLVWLSLLADTCFRFKFQIHAYCQMGNHYHLVLTTPLGDLARGMRYLNGNYSQYVNRQHGLSGHVFQGRYKAILCQREAYLMELSRYVVLNPVRAGIVRHPEHWPWSSYRATIEADRAKPWLQAANILALFDQDRELAIQRYEEFVLQGIGKKSPLSEASFQLLLGDEDFCKQFVNRALTGDPSEINRGERQAVAVPLADYFALTGNQKMAMARAYLSREYSMAEIARHACVSVRTVCRAVKNYEANIGRIDADQR